MKILLCLFFISLLLSNPLNALTIKGGILYTVDTARQDAFYETPLNIDITKYSYFLFDRNHRMNISLIKKNKNKFKDRYLKSFSDGTYALSYTDNLYVAYYYEPNGTLYAFDISDSTSYPRKSCKYNRKGMLEGVSIELSSSEQYIFDVNKRLVAHWIGNNCYDEKGELVMTRK